MSGSLDMEGRLTWGYAAEFFAACLVQAFMLVNVGCTYLLLRWRNRANPKVGVAGVEILSPPTRVTPVLTSDPPLPPPPSGSRRLTAQAIRERRSGVGDYSGVQ